MFGEAGWETKGSWGREKLGVGASSQDPVRNSDFPKDCLKRDFTSLHRQANVNLQFVILDTNSHIPYIMFSILLLLHII